MIGSIAILLFPFLLILAAVQDFVSMKISNKISLTLLLTFPVFAYAYGIDWNTFLLHWLAFAVALAITFSLFAIRVMGGGDAKLIPCIILWLGWSLASAEFVLMCSLFGGVLTMIFLAVRTMPLPQIAFQIPGVSKLHDAGNGIPYGLAIAPAGIMVYYGSEWVSRILG